MKKMLLGLIASMIIHSAYAMDDNKNEQNTPNEVWERRFNHRLFQGIAGSMATIGGVGFASSYIGSARPRFAALSGATLAAASLLALLDKRDSSEITRVYNGKDHPPVVLTGNREEIDEIIKDLRAQMAIREKATQKSSEERQ